MTLRTSGLYREFVPANAIPATAANYSTSGGFRDNVVDITISSDRDGRIICRNDSCPISADIAARELNNTIRNIYQFFERVYQLKGIDNRGSIAPLRIHWNNMNARWECVTNSIQEACSWVFNDFYVFKPEVVAHEYVHGIIKKMSPLDYPGVSHQPGALNESLADCFGIAFKQWATGTKSWNIGELRDISLCFSMADFKTGPASDNNTHDNSLIPSHAFCVAVKSTDKVAYGVISQVWFSSLLVNRDKSTFALFAQITIEVSRRDYSEKITSAIMQAWVHVNVLIPAPQPTPQNKPLGFNRANQYKRQSF